jgi:hypothetical protein
MDKFLYILTVIIIITSACSRDDDARQVEYLVDVVEKASLPKAVLAMGVLSLTDSAGSKYLPLLKNDISIKRITYKTRYNGQDVNASGLLFTSGSLNPHLPTIIYAHATMKREEAPSAFSSVMNMGAETFMCGIWASMFDCAVLMPDYIGYGESKGVVHPYIHVETLGQASLDLILACREYAYGDGGDGFFNSSIFIAGYSEGAHAALALQKRIQESPAAGLRVEKTLAGSGPYDNVAFAKELLSKSVELDKNMIDSYLWAMYMYKTSYGYSKDYADIFSEADNALLGEHGYSLAYKYPLENIPSLNSNPHLLFKQEFIDDVINEADEEFIAILRKNSFVDFTPTDSLIFIYGADDEMVYPSNTINTFNRMKSRGCKVLSYEVADGSHLSTMYTFIDVFIERYRRYNEL